MLGDLAIAYLFLGGAGAGALLVCALVDLVWLREPFGYERPSRGLSRWPVERLLGLALLVGLLMGSIGAGCLTFDLGRADRMLALLILPPRSLMNWGAWGLMALMALGLFLVLVRFLSLPAIGRGVVAATEIALVPVALFVMAYTGFLLQALAGVRFWGLVPVVVLFVLSSLSCGIAVPVVIQALAWRDEFTAQLARTLLSIDLVVVALEIAAAVFLVVLAGGSSHPGIQASYASLMEGSAAPWWWVGFGACGLLAPLVCEAVLLISPFRTNALQLSVAAGVLVLMGGVALRIAIVDAGSFREMELQPPAAEQPSAAPDPAVPEEDPNRDITDQWVFTLQ